MQKAILIKTTGDTSLIDVPEPMDWRWPSLQIGCDLIETVRADVLGENLIMIVDEEGWIRDEPELNPVASVIYGYRQHGQPIAGDVLIMKTVYTEEGPDIGGMSPLQATQAYGRIIDLVIGKE